MNTSRKLPPKTKEVFDRFVRNSNLTSLHASDWELFYEFINFCHDHAVQLDETELVILLKEAGCYDEYARKLASIYYHIRAFMKGVKHRKYKRFWPREN